MSQNYGEESGEENKLVGIPCIGGTAAVSFFGGGLVALMGETEVKQQMELPDNILIYLLRRKMQPISALSEADAHLGVGDMAEYSRRQVEWGQTFGKHIEEEIYPKMILPAMAEGDLEAIGET